MKELALISLLAYVLSLIAFILAIAVIVDL